MVGHGSSGPVETVIGNFFQTFAKERIFARECLLYQTVPILVALRFPPLECISSLSPSIDQMLWRRRLFAKMSQLDWVSSRIQVDLRFLYLSWWFTWARDTFTWQKEKPTVSAVPTVLVSLSSSSFVTLPVVSGGDEDVSLHICQHSDQSNCSDSNGSFEKEHRSFMVPGLQDHLYLYHFEPTQKFVML